MFLRERFYFLNETFLLFHGKSTNNISIKRKITHLFLFYFLFYLKMTTIYLEMQKIYSKYNNKTFFTPIKIKNYPYVLRLITIFAAVKTNRRCETLFIIFYLYIKKKQWKQIGVSNLSLFFHFTINSTHMFIYSNSKEEILRKSSTACSTLVTFLIRR